MRRVLIVMVCLFGLLPAAVAAGHHSSKVTLRVIGRARAGKKTTFAMRVRLAAHGKVRRYRLSFGDHGRPRRGRRPPARATHRYAHAGGYTARLRVWDGRGHRHAAKVRVHVHTVEPAPTPTPTPTASPTPTPTASPSPTATRTPTPTPPLSGTADPVTVAAGSQMPVTLPSGILAVTQVDRVTGDADVSANVHAGALYVAADVAAQAKAATVTITGAGCAAADDCGRLVTLEVPVTVALAQAPPGPLATIAEPSPDREAAAQPIPDSTGLVRLGDELLVTFGTDDAPGDRSQADAAAADVGAVVVGGLDDVGIYQLRWATSQDLDARRTQLLAEPGVTAVTDNAAGDSDPTDTSPPGDWSDDGPAAIWPFDMIRAKTAWDTTTGSDVKVGIVDEGTVFGGHPDLNVVQTLGPSAPAHHATHVAGLACAKANGAGLVGVAWGCPIVTAGKDKWAGGELAAADAMAGVAGVKVINMSLGWPANCVDADTASEQEHWARDNRGGLRRIMAGRGHDIVWTVSAGNNCAPGTLSTLSANFDLKNVITVASVNAGSPSALSAFSNFGYGAEVAAPGGVGAGIAGGAAGVWSTSVSGCILGHFCHATYRQDYGTSMAAPEVAGIAALVRSAHPAFTADQAAQCITRTAGSGPAGLVTFRSDLPADRDPLIAYQPANLPVVDAANAVACNGSPPPDSSVLIVGDGDFGSPEPLDNLNTLLTESGYQVTELPDLALPPDLSPYAQVWVVATDPLSTTDADALAQYAKTGHGVYLTGERPCCEELNAWDSSVVNQLVVSVGGIQIGGLGDPFYDVGPLPINSDAVSGVAQQPNTLDTWQPAAPGGMGNVADANVFATAPDGTPVAAVWGSGDVIDGGRLAVLMDVNWLEMGWWDQPTASHVAQNLAFFLSGAAQPPAAAALTARAPVRANQQSLVRRLSSSAPTGIRAGPTG